MISWCSRLFFVGSIALLLHGSSSFLLPKPSSSSSSTRSSMKTAVGLASEKVTTDSGLVYEDMVVGDGRAPQAKDFVAVHYTCKLAKTGKILDASRPTTGVVDERPESFQGKPIQFQLSKGQVVQGMEEGVATNMNVGGSRRLYVPSKLAYGAKGYRDIPPNADLIFDVELMDVPFMMSGQLGAAGTLFDGFKIAFGLIAVNGLTQLVTGHELREYIVNAMN